MDRKEYLRQYYKKYYKEHIEQEKRRAKKYYSDNKTEISKRRHERYINNPKELENAKNYYWTMEGLKKRLLNMELAYSKLCLYVEEKYGENSTEVYERFFKGDAR